MIIEELSTQTAGSCNFCNKGKLTSNGRGLSYPYENVYTLSGTGVKVNVCLDCLSELGKFIEEGLC